MEKDFFSRGVVEVIDKKSLEERLRSGQKLRVKLGVDPTRPDLHLGHAVVLRKLKEFQQMGHAVIFLLGDYTAKVGDPSGKNKARPEVSDTEIEANAKTYLEQAGKILDLSKVELRRNSEWFSKMDFNNVLKLVAKFTLAQIIERDDFHKRLEIGADVGMHEILYPVMQAYDSVMLKADVEIGGTDQKFNLLAGRALQKKMGQRPQEIMTVPLLIGLDGREKMSKSLDNYIGVAEAPDEQFGKLMSIPDNLIITYFELVTDISEATIKKDEKAIAKGANPRDFKEKLAYDIVKMYHSETAAKTAKENFNKRFREKQLPDELPVVNVKAENVNLIELIILADESLSKSEARRLVHQGGVRIDGVKMTDPDETVGIPAKGITLEVGKLRAYKII